MAQMRGGKTIVGVPWVLAPAVAALACAAAWFAWFYAPATFDDALDDAGRALDVRAEVRRRAIETWLESGKADAATVARFPSTPAVAGLRPGVDPDAEYAGLLRDYAALHGYAAILVLDDAGRTVFSTGALTDVEERGGGPGVDLVRGPDGTVWARFAAPIGNGPAAIVLLADPERDVYPLLTLQPLTLASSESILVREEGGRLRYLSPLAGELEAPLRFSRPVAGSGLETLEALGGPRRIGGYRDYRGKEVVAASRRLTAAPWGLVVKADRDEVLAPVRRRLLREGLIGGGFLVTSFVLLVYAAWVESHRAAAALEQSRNRLAHLLDQVADAILLVSSDGRVLETNRAAESMYGPGFDRAGVGAALAEAIPRGRGLIEAVQRRADGSEFPAEIALRRVEEDSGTVLLAVVRDVTERKRAEGRILALNRMLRTRSEVNQLLVRERDRERLLDGACRILVDHGGFETASIRFEAGAAAPSVVGRDATMPIGDDGVLVVRAPDSMALDAEILALLRETAEDVAFGLEAIRRHEKLEGILAASATPILSLDREERITYWNPACERVFGWTAREASGRPLRGADESADGDFRSLIARALGGASLAGVEVRLMRRDASPVDLLLSTAPIRDVRKGIAGVTGVFVDLTARKQAEDEVRRLNLELEQRVLDRTAALEAANAELEAFSYSVSHDLRAPLRGIDGFSRMLEEDYGPRLDDEGRRLLAVVRDSTRQMGQLIDDLLLFSRAGRHEIRRARVDMTALARAVALELVPDPETQGVDLRLGPLPDARADGALMRQVFRNLLSNALKFSAPKGRRTIEVSGTTTGEETVYTVRDDGVGFDPRYARKLFGVFQRLHGPREFEGTGVGLAIVQRIVHRHGGRVFAEGEPGRGAEFGFAFPREGADE